jgi:itaconate CoA-transferase
MSGYGSAGPYRDRRAYDMLVQIEVSMLDATNVARVRNRSTVDKLVAEGTVRMTADRLVERLDAAGIASARLNSVLGLIDHPQLAARDRWREVDTPVGRVPAMLPPEQFADIEAAMGPVPALGEHTGAVLTELGYTAAQIADFRQSGVIGSPD